MRRVLVLAAAALAVLAGAPAALAHQGNPNMESIVRAVRPHVAGLTLDVLNRDDRFALVYDGPKTIVVYGYNGDQYARVLPGGVVQVNHNSPAYYLNQDRYGNVDIPSSASARATPDWQTVDRSGRLEWHDHRMHYMGTGVPTQVKDRSKRQKVFDYRIPITVAGRHGAILGTLEWTPQSDGGGPPVAAIAGFAALVLAGAGLVVVVRRRRRGGRGGDGGGAPGGPDGTSGTAPERSSAEVW